MDTGDYVRVSGVWKPVGQTISHTSGFLTLGSGMTFTSGRLEVDAAGNFVTLTADIGGTVPGNAAIGTITDPALQPLLTSFYPCVSGAGLTYARIRGLGQSPPGQIWNYGAAANQYVMNLRYRLK